MGYFGICALFCMILIGCSHPTPSSKVALQDFRLPDEKYFKSVRQITHAGIHRNANWSRDGSWLTFEKKNPNGCFQIFRMRSDGTESLQVSGDKGNSRHSSFFPNDQRILFSSTLALRTACPEETEAESKNFFSANFLTQIYGVYPDGRDIIPLEPAAPRAYNSEATLCQNRKIVFTSSRDGDFQLYSAQMDSFGSMQKIQKITNTPGYHGGTRFSADCKKIAWHHYSPATAKEKKDFEKIYPQQMIDLKRLEIWIANSDGSNANPLTHFGVKSFNPTFTPDGNHIVFASNLKNPQKDAADLYVISIDGNGIERISNSNGFDGYPVFSPNGHSLVFSSSRNAQKPGDLNLFLAEWSPSPLPSK